MRIEPVPPRPPALDAVIHLDRGDPPFRRSDLGSEMTLAGRRAFVVTLGLSSDGERHAGVIWLDRNPTTPKGTR